MKHSARTAAEALAKMGYINPEAETFGYTAKRVYAVDPKNGHRYQGDGRTWGKAIEDLHNGRRFAVEGR